ncbi:MAG: hypothetical protein HOV79_08750 [Hamadaea sp.]|nr:hypothetical protein [Hamadaea sp.]
MKTWGRAIGAAFFFAAVMGAAQVGVASVLGVVHLDGAYADPDHWVAQTVFLAWFAQIAVLVGTTAAARSAGLATRVSAAAVAGVGSALGSAIALFPARDARIPKDDPLLSAALALIIGALAGIVVAFAMLSARSLGWSAAAQAVAVWAFVATAVAADLDGVPARLGQVVLGDLPVRGVTLWGLPVIAALLGLTVALVARVRGHHRLAIALSGASGPATVALAYLVAGPGATDFQRVPWIASLIAVAAGLAASVLVALPPRKTAEEESPALTSDGVDDAPLPSRSEWQAGQTTAPRQRGDDAVESWVSGLGGPKASPTPASSPAQTPEADSGHRPRPTADTGFVPRPLG